MKATRDAFGEALLELGKLNEKIVVLSGDLEDSTRAEYFKKEFPERFYNLGIAEQDVIGTAVGFSLAGYTAFVSSFAVFLTNRPYDMIRISVCYNNQNVKIAATHSGVTVGEDGATAQCLEDIAIMRVLPNMKVICPADAIEAKKATIAIANIYGPCYLRLARAKYPIITREEDKFEIGKANILREGKDLTIIACGLMVSKALNAADTLAKQGIEARVVNMHTIKPIDRELIIDSVKKTGAIVTAEEHQIHGGLFGAVCEVVSKECPVPVQPVAVNDSFGRSGKPDELLKYYKLTEEDIVTKAKSICR